MLSRIAKVSMVIAVLASLSGCFPFWGPHHGGGGHGDHRFDGGPRGGYYGGPPR
jgi:hypothetical protein